MLMVSVSVLSFHKNKDILLCVSYLLSFIQKTLTCFTFNTSISRCVSHADCANIMLMVSVSFLSFHKNRDLLLRVSYLLFFIEKTLTCFIFNTSISRNDVVVLTLYRKMPAEYFNQFLMF